MIGKFVIFVIFFVVFVSLASIPIDKYWFLREHFLKAEEEQSIGGDLSLNPDEKRLNDILMNHKKAEIDQGILDPNSFLPSKSFLITRHQIEASKVFKIIKKLPKGAVLHAHSAAIVPADWTFNATYRENLYVSNESGWMSLEFFKNPPESSRWKLLSDLRKDPKVASALNKDIRDRMSMEVDNPDAVYTDVNKIWDKFNDIFRLQGAMITEIYEDYLYEALNELYEDNVMYLELRLALLKLTTDDLANALRKITRVDKRFRKEHPDFIGVKVIIAVRRSVNPSQFKNYINRVLKLQEMFPEYIVGLDLIGQEDRGRPLKEFSKELTALRDRMYLFLHAGETNWYGTPIDENLIDAVLLNTKRIGHAYAIIKHPKLVEYVKEHRIAIEVCPISNQVLGLVKDLRNHPAAVLFAENVPVVISNDDPGLWGAKGLSYDFYEAFMGIMSRNMDIRALKQLAMNSIIFSGLDGEKKTTAMKIWRRKWSVFVEEIINGDY